VSTQFSLVRDDRTDTQTISESIRGFAAESGLERRDARLRLVKIGKPAVPALEAALQDRREQVRWEAAKALSQIGDPDAAPVLVKALDDQDFGVRWLAAEGLIATGREGLTPLLTALVKHSDSKWLREGAHHVVRTMVGVDNLHDILAPVLAALNDVEPVIEVPPAAQDAIEELTQTTH
jgi:HEAT repeat protein